MAASDRFANADIQNGVLARASEVSGSPIRRVLAKLEILSTEEDGSVFRLARVPSDMIVTDIRLFCDAITGGNDFDIGLYDTDQNGGAVVDKDVFLDGKALTSAITISGTAGLGASGLTGLDIASLNKTLFGHAGKTIATRKAEYDIAITANDIGTTGGTVVAIIDMVQG